MMSNERLQEFFPKYRKELEALEMESACGCSICVWQVFHKKHPKLKLPKSVEEYVAWA